MRHAYARPGTLALARRTLSAALEALIRNNESDWEIEMRSLWVILTILFGALALLLLLRVAEKVLTRALTGQAGVQLLLGFVFGLLAWRALSNARLPRA